MKLAALLLTLYAMLAAACYFPFNDARFVNKTLLEEHLQDLVPDAGSGWVTAVLGQQAPYQPWPPSNPKVLPMVTIVYCFSNSYQRSVLVDFVDKAWQKWHAKLGDPSKENGHCMKGFRELKQGGQPVLCRVPGGNLWNPMVPKHVLEIALETKGEARSFASLGFTKSSRSDKSGRHGLIVYQKIDPEITLADVIHEMGHVFGLVHEFQRDDRDDYVYYDCTKLPSYEDVKKFAEESVKIDPYAPTIEPLCDGDSYAASFYGWFWPKTFSKDLGMAFNAPQLKTHGSTYDHNSIMGYSSLDPSLIGTYEVTDSPIVKWRNGRPADGSKPNAQNAELIPYPMDVTDGDVEGVKAIYPWK